MDRVRRTLGADRDLLHEPRRAAVRGGRGLGRHGRGAVHGGRVFGKFSAKCRSFSAVSAPIFASKYALCSIFQNLPHCLAEIFEIW